MYINMRFASSFVDTINNEIVFFSIFLAEIGFVINFEFFSWFTFSRFLYEGKKIKLKFSVNTWEKNLLGFRIYQCYLTEISLLRFPPFLLFLFSLSQPSSLPPFLLLSSCYPLSFFSFSFLFLLSRVCSISEWPFSQSVSQTDRQPDIFLVKQS